MIVKKRNKKYPFKSGGMKIVINENIEKIIVPMKTIHFLIILSAKKPNINIAIPVKMVNENVSIPKGVVFPPNPK